ncbi:MAG: aldo/keto reductase [Rectinemataceae bacterium]
MNYRTIGHTGIRASVLGFGCMRLPTLGAPDKIDEETATKLLRDAIEHGVNYVDTAWFYHATSFGQAGQSEPFVGRALSDGWRERILLATKLPQQIIRERGDMDRFLAQQLERLRTDHVDFYLVHGLDGDAWNRMRDLGVREFLDGARERGLIRFPAFSFHGHKDDFPLIIDEYEGWAFGQQQYNYMDTDYQAGYSGLRYAAEKGLGVVVMEPLKGGRLARNLPPEMKAVFDGQPEGWSPAEWALRYVWNEPGVSLLLSGMNDSAQLEENLRIAEAAEPGVLTSGHRAVYEAARVAMKARMKADCSACRYCQPCEQGVEIPELLAALNAAAMWDTKDQWLTGFSRIKGKPEACIECGECEDMCPQKLPIRALLKETAAAFAG